MPLAYSGFTISLNTSLRLANSSISVELSVLSVLLILLTQGQIDWNGLTGLDYELDRKTPQGPK